MKKLVLLLPLLFILSCQSGVFKNDLSEILGVSNVEIKNSRGADEFGGFSEGYTIEIYELSEETTKAFIAQSNKILPSKEGWKKFDWSKTPVDTSYTEIFGILNYMGGKKVENLLSEIKVLLKKTEVYYSFYYKPDKDNPQDLQLFVLDTKSKKLHIVECNL